MDTGSSRSEKNCDGPLDFAQQVQEGFLQKDRKWGSLKLEKGLFLGASLLRLKIAFDNNRSFAKSSGLIPYPERELSMVGQWGAQGSVRI